MGHSQNILYQTVGFLPHIRCEHDSEVGATGAQRHFVAVEDYAGRALKSDIGEQALRVEPLERIKNLVGVGGIAEIIRVLILTPNGHNGPEIRVKCRHRVVSVPLRKMH